VTRLHLRDRISAPCWFHRRARVHRRDERRTTGHHANLGDGPELLRGCLPISLLFPFTGSFLRALPGNGKYVSVRRARDKKCRDERNQGGKASLSLVRFLWNGQVRRVTDLVTFVSIAFPTPREDCQSTHRTFIERTRGALHAARTKSLTARNRTRVARNDNNPSTACTPSYTNP